MGAVHALKRAPEPVAADGDGSDGGRLLLDFVLTLKRHADARGPFIGAAVGELLCATIDELERHGRLTDG